MCASLVWGYSFLNMEQEVWKDIRGYEGLYQVSNYGNIRSVPHSYLTKSGKKMVVSGRLLAPRLHNKGYYTISLYCGKHRKQFYVHRLVASHFCCNPNKYPCVNHIDNNPSNNRACNLEWCTHKQNTAHALKQHRLITPADMGYRKQKQPYRICLTDGTHIGDYPSIADAMIAIGENPLNHAPINNIRLGMPYKGKYVFSKLPRLKNTKL